MEQLFKVRIVGTPQQQGSTRAFAFKRKSGKLGVAVTSTNKNLMPWRDRVSQALVDKCEELGLTAPAFSGAVCVEMVAIMPRLKTMPKTDKGAKRLPVGSPDLDKLQRAAGDSLTESGCIEDDSRICHWDARKRYAEIGELAGMELTVRGMQA